MFDRFDRDITYLRISVTDRCNLRCIYCMPPEGIVMKEHRDILSYEQIEAFARKAVATGMTKIRLTGGEPLVRREVPKLVSKLARIRGLRDLAMSTNGTRLREMARELKDSGLMRVNVSLDSLDPDAYRRVTRGGDLNRVLGGIDEAVRVGLHPVKINMVILDQTGADALRRMQRFCRDRGLVLQTISRFSLADREASMHPEADRPPACARCNRLRLTADGFLRPCLFSDEEIPVDFRDIEGSIRRAVAAKPANGSSCRTRVMCQIGG
jgi:cyclic pyranopterin phosphate synthase